MQADPAKIYSGRILDIRDGQIIQKSGRGDQDMVKHNIDQFDQQMTIGQNAIIRYRNGKASAHECENGLTGKEINSYNL